MSEENISSEELQDLAHLESLASEDESINSEEITEEEGKSSEDLPTDQVLMMAISPLFDVIAPNWKVKNEEKQALCSAYAPVIDKYFGGMALGVEVQALVVTAMILAPRINTPRIIEPVKEEVTDNGG